MNNLQIALKYGAAGMAIFPCGNDKRPLLKEWLAKATTNEKTIQRWWLKHSDALVGLPLKPLNLVVIDADRHKADEDGIKTLRTICAKHGDMPPHPWATTANDGVHHYFAQPAREKIGNKKIAPGLETRGFKPNNDGGFVIASGSQLNDGRRWWRGEGSPSLIESYAAGNIPPAPPWLRDGVQKKPEPSIPTARRNTYSNGSGLREQAYAAAALDGIAADLAKVATGERNNALNSAAFRCGTMIARGWISRTDVGDALYSACQQNGLVADDGADSVQQTMASGLDAGEKEPAAPLSDRDDYQQTNGSGAPKTTKTKSISVWPQ
jgi:Bifunctional DNA primase/polymerase, N-terminal